MIQYAPPVGGLSSGSALDRLARRFGVSTLAREKSSGASWVSNAYWVRGEPKAPNLAPRNPPAAGRSTRKDGRSRHGQNLITRYYQ